MRKYRAYDGGAVVSLCAAHVDIRALRVALMTRQSNGWKNCDDAAEASAAGGGAAATGVTDDAAVMAPGAGNGARDDAVIANTGTLVGAPDGDINADGNNGASVRYAP